MRQAAMLHASQMGDFVPAWGKFRPNFLDPPVLQQLAAWFSSGVSTLENTGLSSERARQRAGRIRCRKRGRRSAPPGVPSPRDEGPAAFEFRQHSYQAQSQRGSGHGDPVRTARSVMRGFIRIEVSPPRIREVYDTILATL